MEQGADVDWVASTVSLNYTLRNNFWAFHLINWLCDIGSEYLIKIFDFIKPKMI